MSNFISIDRAKKMIGIYRQKKNEIVKEEFKGLLPNSETFDRAQFDIILKKEGCVGLRIYYGMDDESRIHAIIIGVNEKNEDIIAAAAQTSTSDGEDAIEDGNLCPPYCPPPSGLEP